ncbi:threonine--tRNA ligase [Candidatus Jorgensenbacteria bacterium CG_4_10_14_0_8_um_filter_39_13]|uniref:Threonine--tRNA ligase n=2 Tax=Candidatus Joergenseniibacteriota TaxID=1752739 RepID=A0A2M7RIB1_9BACT|nr:MAG: threonine--tRNA ligase [Candidatus Jorgensenbacteria bacterium CG11_big_fil_rev_8_21_14_0_20_38_23]PIV13442.1 MAG: threonine--tRNA ligase [Candidatus Jorgensenbacteria bacterium CG03_land_8_20_14_0_80_38_39]PIW97436.1 MAG: threonine--tRNA ligase [Candidatus Jorgensenbacteria bacterium CG_4_8_14_3_um_filter_38_10]PIY96479.1 MAG: threonine--tRNA ligase [Candidatus Jorgensenbacteria bacterium CG_4_10_14_0_8_um_filter_39_13]
MKNIEHIRHSLAHLLAAAVLKKFPKAKLGIGPVIENGFYYDFLLPRSLNEEDLKEFEKTIKEFIKKHLPFRGQKITFKEAKKVFKGQPFKLELIKEFTKPTKGVKKEPLTVYITGDKNQRKSVFNPRESAFYDLCRGGHVKNTKEINPEAFKLTRIAGAYWRGDEKNPQLQRIYGIAFGDEKKLEDYLKLQEEIERRDHRKIGADLDLFSFHSVAPGAVFWHNKGMIIWRELEKFMREKLDRDGYEEISTPVMVKKEVFEKSGHWQYYRENMFYFNLPEEKETYVLKPMNCPESTYIYASRIRSYKDLPLRFSEITDRLHRNERSGTLGGLLRVRQMTQDDAHIYCRPDQIEEEIKKLLDLVTEVYKVFKFPLTLNLATRPDKAMGEIKLWQRAEAALKSALKKSKIKFQIKPKDGTFYGPKIDVNVKDVLGREWTIATIQLDFQLAGRFNLSFINLKGKKEKPIIIHRAILGTFERFIGILLEHTAGNLPVWLSPVQVRIVPVADRHYDYAEKIAVKFKTAGLRVDIASRGETLGKNIRTGELEKIPYLLVVGDREIKKGAVNVRERGRKETVSLSLKNFIANIKKAIESKK